MIHRVQLIGSVRVCWWFLGAAVNSQPIQGPSQSVCAGDFWVQQWTANPYRGRQTGNCSRCGREVSLVVTLAWFWNGTAGENHERQPWAPGPRPSESVPYTCSISAYVVSAWFFCCIEPRPCQSCHSKNSGPTEHMWVWIPLKYYKW